jgi:hypothetical protein
MHRLYFNIPNLVHRRLFRTVDVLVVAAVTPTHQHTRHNNRLILLRFKGELIIIAIQIYFWRQ